MPEVWSLKPAKRFPVAWSNMWAYNHFIPHLTTHLEPDHELHRSRSRPHFARRLRQLHASARNDGEISGDSDAGRVRVAAAELPRGAAWAGRDVVGAAARGRGAARAEAPSCHRAARDGVAGE